MNDSDETFLNEGENDVNNDQSTATDDELHTTSQLETEQQSSTSESRKTYPLQLNKLVKNPQLLIM